MQTKRWLGWLGVIVVGGIAGLAVFLLLLEIQHLRQDEANIHALVQLINYNVQAGKLIVPEAPAASAAPKPPESPPK